MRSEPERIFALAEKPRPVRVSERRPKASFEKNANSLPFFVAVSAGMGIG
jgi:hypothetical protein